MTADRDAQRRHIAAEWASFSEHVLPPSAPPIQRQEMRRAFYAGAGAILHRLMRLVSTEDEMTPEDEQILIDMDAELEEWLAEMQAGRR